MAVTDKTYKISGPLAEKVVEKLDQVEAAYSDTSKEFIRVYRFREAPEQLKALSPHGGDEDWLAVVPSGYSERHYISWLESGSSFGVCSVSEHVLVDDTRIYIGAHA